MLDQRIDLATSTAVAIADREADGVLEESDDYEEWADRWMGVYTAVLASILREKAPKNTN